MRHILRFTVVVGALHTSLAGPIGAQARPEPGDRAPAGYGFFMPGIVGLDLDPLNARLAAEGLPALDENVPVWGGGGYGVVGKFHFGGVGHGGLDPSVTAGSRRASLKGGYGLARVRYQALSLGGLSVFPAVGLGAGGMSLQLTELDTPTFDEIIQDPERGATLSTGVVFLLNAGLGLDYRFQVKELADGGAWGLVLGVEGGYLYSPGDTSWELDGISEVPGGPDLGIEGFYVWFSLGGWGREAAER